ncbi:hypothetical protein BaRGS_00013790, partial [Batillaria attramentaria]
DSAQRLHQALFVNHAPSIPTRNTVFHDNSSQGYFSLAVTTKYDPFPGVAIRRTISYRPDCIVDYGQ